MLQTALAKPDAPSGKDPCLNARPRAEDEE